MRAALMRVKVAGEAGRESPRSPQAGLPRTARQAGLKPRRCTPITSFPIRMVKGDEIMMVARWSIDAKFGDKQAVVDLMQRWLREIGPKAGVKPDRTRLLTGSVGALEATVQSEHVV